MSIKYIIWPILGVFALTLAGCTARPGAFVEKRIERAKLLNEIFASTEDEKLKDAQIDTVVTKELKDQVESQMKVHCSRQEINELVKNETCYVDKLKDIRAKKDRGAVPSSRIKCQVASLEKMKGTCREAIKPLIIKLDENTMMH